jgi:FtsH-binding integral membrane protein
MLTLPLNIDSVRITACFLLIVLGAIVQSFAPWYSLGLVALVLGFGFRQQAGQAFLTGLLGGFLLWAGYAGYLHFLNEGILGDRMGRLFGGADGWAIVGITGLLGGLLAAVGCWTGQALRQVIRPYAVRA